MQGRPLNTAVFWDIENLFGGYGFNDFDPAELSLKTVVDAIREVPVVNRIAIQRAYANWSHPRLASLRMELNELGIEPVQVFAFGRDTKKNAADIQLVIDALEVLAERPGIEVFVVVSGDGGFSTLVRKLHEHSRYVIVAAMGGSANATLMRVCDHFVSLTNPSAGAKSSPARNGAAPSLPATDDPLCRGLSRIAGSPTRQQLREGLAIILRNVSTSPQYRSTLNESGINLSVVQPALRWLLGGDEGLDRALVVCGKGSLGQVIRDLLDNNYVMARHSSGDTRIFHRQSRLAHGWAVLQAEPLPELHSVESYRAILGSERFGVRIRLPENRDVFEEVLDRLGDASLRGMALGEIVAQVAEGSGEGDSVLPVADVRGVVYALTDLDQLALSPGEAGTSLERKFSGWKFARDTARANLATEAKAKLEKALGEPVQTEIFGLLGLD